MASSSPWPTIHTERAALADDLQELTDAQWLERSLCARWSVRDVLAHMTATAKMTPGAFLGKLAGSGFRFNTMTANGIAAETVGTPAQSLAQFRAQQSSTKHPPGPTVTWLGETIVHAEDIRRPLGIHHAYPTAAVVQLAEFYSRSNALIGSKKRITGLRLAATDADWSAGSGPEVSGPVLSLVLAMTGRGAALSDLTGPGVDTLRSRAG
ncbi:MAG: maleylpyruvate isomerase family mycothiol-dependent enzyme [Actinomycetota bacterium]|nr:maleylpyruvate isomerase family mycothiol-dependent enzyme [Actinomycetota bacterium]